MKSTLYRLQLDISNWVNDCFDGAADMSGEHKGVQVRINEGATHTWNWFLVMSLHRMCRRMPAFSDYFTKLHPSL